MKFTTYLLGFIAFVVFIVGTISFFSIEEKTTNNYYNNLISYSGPFKIAEATGTIVLNSDNSFSFVGNVDEYLSNEFLKKIILYDKNIMYIYIESNGGSVYYLNKMINAMKSRKDIKFNCTADIAASAAFIFLQYCDIRNITEGAILMSHNAYIVGSTEQEIPKSQLNALNRIVERLERTVAIRMKMSYEQYKKEIEKEMWIDASVAFKYNAIDEIVFVTCSPDTLDDTQEECQSKECALSKQSKNKCPLISSGN